ncbi:anti-sigma factor [Curvivirga aplysinae]|uniref:hypothetical protein n=1 Tax=Curvivirga aplysinae TaxID=2529852 RepID=UPI0012BB67FF|nr:hypothetical protein [Curvivirga aplysinae]MTI08988.1 hypothetical protein [Curvivirga aplysinae]
MTKEIEELLPFYVNGSLTEAEREIVEKALTNSAELQAELDYLTNLYQSLNETEALKSPGEFGLKRLQKEIRREAEKDDFIQQVTEKVAPEQNNNIWRIATIAACLLLAIQTTVVLPEWGQEDDLNAAGASTAIFIKGTVLSVTFNPAAREESIRDLLLTVDAQIVDGPSALGVYQIAVSGDVEDISEKLLAYKNLIESVQIDSRN